MFTHWIAERATLRRIARWAENHATPLSDAATVMAPCLDGHELIYLGESDHFVHEAHVVRRLILPFLLRRGATAVLEEMSAADGRLMNRFLRTGQQTALDGATTFGDLSCLRPDRNDRLGGLLGLGSDPDRYPYVAMRFEHQLSLESTLGLSHERVGIDLDAVPGAAYRELHIKRRLGESRTDEIVRLRAWLRENPGDLDVIEPMIDGLEFVERSHRAQTWSEVDAALARREEGLIKRAQRALERHARAVIVAHCGHLSRSPDLSRLDDHAGPPSRSLGLALAKDRSVGAIWMLHAEGRSSHPFAGVDSHHSARRGTVNSVLSRIGDSFVLPIRGTEGEGLLATEQLFSWSFGARFRTSLAKVADAIVFFRTTTPLREA